MPRLRTVGGTEHTDGIGLTTAPRISSGSAAIRERASGDSDDQGAAAGQSGSAVAEMGTGFRALGRLRIRLDRLVLDGDSPLQKLDGQR